MDATLEMTGKIGWHDACTTLDSGEVVKFYKFGTAHFFIIGKFMIYWGKNGKSISFGKLVFLNTVR